MRLRFFWVYYRIYGNFLSLPLTVRRVSSVVSGVGQILICDQRIFSRAWLRRSFGRSTTDDHLPPTNTEVSVPRHARKNPLGVTQGTSRFE